jgi:hypothetical protein
MYTVQRYKKRWFTLTGHSAPSPLLHAVCGQYMYVLCMCITVQHVHVISYLWTYDLYGLVRNALLLMRAASITRASGRGFGPGNRDFFGPYAKWHRADRRMPFVAQKSVFNTILYLILTKQSLPLAQPVRTLPR